MSINLEQACDLFFSIYIYITLRKHVTLSKHVIYVFQYILMYKHGRKEYYLSHFIHMFET